MRAKVFVSQQPFFKHRPQSHSAVKPPSRALFHYNDSFIHGLTATGLSGRRQIHFPSPVIHVTSQTVTEE